MNEFTLKTLTILQLITIQKSSTISNCKQ